VREEAMQIWGAQLHLEKPANAQALMWESVNVLGEETATVTVAGDEGQKIKVQKSSGKGPTVRN
jgi:hypothetical protein